MTHTRALPNDKDTHTARRGDDRRGIGRAKPDDAQKAGQDKRQCSVKEGRRAGEEKFGGGGNVNDGRKYEVRSFFILAGRGKNGGGANGRNGACGNGFCMKRPANVVTQLRTQRLKAVGLKFGFFRVRVIRISISRFEGSVWNFAAFLRWE